MAGITVLPNTGKFNMGTFVEHFNKVSPDLPTFAYLTGTCGNSGPITGETLVPSADELEKRYDEIISHYMPDIDCLLGTIAETKKTLMGYSDGYKKKPGQAMNELVYDREVIIEDSTSDRVNLALMLMTRDAIVEHFKECIRVLENA